MSRTGVKHIKYTEKNTASHGKANTYVVKVGYPSEVLFVLCTDEDDLVQYILCWQGVYSVLADTHRLVQVGQHCGVTVHLTVLSTQQSRGT